VTEQALLPSRDAFISSISFLSLSFPFSSFSPSFYLILFYPLPLPSCLFLFLIRIPSIFFYFILFYFIFF